MVALGAIARTLPIPGLAEHALGFKDLADAIELRNHVLRQLEAADAALDPGRPQRHLTFVFVGAGYAGVEALAELSDLVRDALRYYPRLRGRASSAGCSSTRRRRSSRRSRRRLGDYAARELAQRGVEIRVATTLESAEADAATLSDGERIETTRSSGPPA